MKLYKELLEDLKPPRYFSRLENFVFYSFVAVGSALPAAGFRYFVFHEMRNKYSGIEGEFYSWGVSLFLGVFAALTTAPLFANIFMEAIERVKYQKNPRGL